MVCNAKGLLQHHHELHAVLFAENVDICLASETHLSTESFVKFKNFSTSHSVNPAYMARNGCAVVIKNNINHFVEEKYVSCDI